MSPRVIGGIFKNRTLITPKGLQTRPSSGLLRKVIFDLIGMKIRDAVILDLFAGAGPLGIEGMSRGGKECTYVEHDKAALCALEENISRFSLNQVSMVVRRNVETYIKDTKKKFDGILLDPPYVMEDFLSKYPLWHLLNEKGWLVYQHAVDMPNTVSVEFERFRQKNHGKTTITIYEL
jgi:16S rRNA (guanine(966)-N(2))-methyltransferase RsmD